MSTFPAIDVMLYLSLHFHPSVDASNPSPLIFPSPAFPTNILPRLKARVSNHLRELWLGRETPY